MNLNENDKTKVQPHATVCRLLMHADHLKIACIFSRRAENQKQANPHLCLQVLHMSNSVILHVEHLQMVLRKLRNAQLWMPADASSHRDDLSLQKLHTHNCTSVFYLRREDLDAC